MPRGKLKPNSFYSSHSSEKKELATNEFFSLHSPSFFFFSTLVLNFRYRLFQPIPMVSNTSMILQLLFLHLGLVWVMKMKHLKKLKLWILLYFLLDKLVSLLSNSIFFLVFRFFLIFTDAFLYFLLTQFSLVSSKSYQICTIDV